MASTQEYIGNKLVSASSQEHRFAAIIAHNRHGNLQKKKIQLRFDFPHFCMKQAKILLGVTKIFFIQVLFPFSLVFVIGWDNEG